MSFHYPSVILLRVPFHLLTGLLLFDYTGEKITINVESLVQVENSLPPHCSFQVIYFSLHIKCVTPSEISVAPQLAQVWVIFHSGRIFYT